MMPKTKDPPPAPEPEPEPEAELLEDTPPEPTGDEDLDEHGRPLEAEGPGER
jgi:hypothetical protein